MVFDPTDTEIDNYKFVREYWSDSAYIECKEELPPNAPQPKGIGFTMRAFVDSNNSGELTTRQSRTGFIIFLNSARIYGSRSAKRQWKQAHLDLILSR